MKFTVSFITAALFFCGLYSHAQGRQDSVVLLPLKIAAPDGAKKLGSIKAGNNAVATKCDYEAIVNEAKDKARAMGGNIVKITKLIAPAFISKCYKIEADVYYTDRLPDYPVQQSMIAPLPDAGNTGYALLCLYRLADTIAFATPYKVHMGKDSVICTVKSKSRDSVILYSDGPVILWAETESRKELKLNVKKGETYYIRCGLIPGEIRMAPLLELVDKETGAKEYGEKKEKKKNADVGYLQHIH